MEEKLAKLNTGLNANKRLSNSSIKEKQAGSLGVQLHRVRRMTKNSLNKRKSIGDEETECRRSGRFFEVLLLYFLCILTYKARVYTPPA